MPLISIRLVAGRDVAQLRTLVSEVSKATATALDIPVERVTVHLLELALDRVGRGGELLGDVMPQTARPTERSALPDGR